MNLEEKHFGERVLSWLCQRGQIDGIRFGPVLQILISPPGVENHPGLKGQIYLNLGSWTIFPHRPKDFPTAEWNDSDISVEEQLRQLCDLSEQMITSVELGDEIPHLILSLSDGRVLFVNGNHAMYESWGLGVAFSAENWIVIACPGGGLAIGTPTSFE